VAVLSLFVGGAEHDVNKADLTEQLAHALNVSTAEVRVAVEALQHCD
jgi:hypothetical protein